MKQFNQIGNNLQILLQPKFISNPLPQKRLSYIWHKVKTSTGWTLRIKEGDQVLVIGNTLCNCHDKPSHVITSLWDKKDGKGYEITVISLKDQSLLIVKL